jgi:BRCT domain type II-containing protein
MTSIPTSPTSLPTTLTTSNKLRIRRRRRHQTLLISTVKVNTLTTTPLSNTSSSQSNYIFRQSVLDKAEEDLLNAAAVNRPEIAVGAASDNAIV